MGSFIGYSVRPEGSSGSHLDPTDGSGSLHAQLVPEVESARNTNEDAIAVKWVSSPSCQTELFRMAQRYLGS